MVLQAFVDDGNEVLVPAPDYPLWTGAVSLSGGTPVHYRCDEANGWNPDLEDIEAKITENTHALVDHQPEQPDRRGLLARRPSRRSSTSPAATTWCVMADEIYEKILFDDAVHHHAATFAGDDVLCLTFSGLSKAYRVCGYRAGWVMVSGPEAPGRGLPRGPHPAVEHADVRERARRSTRSRRRWAATSRSPS